MGSAAYIMIASGALWALVALTHISAVRHAKHTIRAHVAAIKAIGVPSVELRIRFPDLPGNKGVVFQSNAEQLYWVARYGGYNTSGDEWYTLQEIIGAAGGSIVFECKPLRQSIGNDNLDALAARGL